MPKRILIDARPLVDPQGGGVKRVGEQAVRALLASSLDAEYFFVTTGLKNNTLPEWIISDSRCHSLHIRWPNKIWSLASAFGIVTIDGQAMRQLPEEDKKKPFDKAIILNLGFTGFTNTPYALLLHDLSFEINPRWFTLKSRLWHYAVNPKELVRRATKIFSVSETTARDAVRIYGCETEKIEIVKPGIRREGRGVRDEVTDENLTSHVPSLTSPPTPYALVLGAGDPRKNVPTAIKAFEILKQDPAFAEFKLIVVGSSRPTIYDLRSTAINFRYSLSDAELDQLYANASIFLYPSWYEGYGLPPHEAARFETPCITSTDGALPETAPEGTVFVPPSKPHLWAKAIHDVLATPNLYHTKFDEELEKPHFSHLIEWIRN
jgi:glycosyltransferase involved in cell wall biosynthesis